MAIETFHDQMLEQTLSAINNDLAIVDIPLTFKNQFDGTILIEFNHIPSTLINHDSHQLFTNLTLTYILTPDDVQLDSFRHYLTLNCSDLILHAFDNVVHQFEQLAHNQHNDLLLESIQNHAASGRVKLESWLTNLAN